MSKHPKADIYLAERDNGMTYREIAEKYGVSCQCVHICCMNNGGVSKKEISPRGCIYPNLRKWLNEDKDRQNRFIQAMKDYPVREYMKGERQPKKNAIDLMLKVTGMTYEELFKEEDYGEE